MRDTPRDKKGAATDFGRYILELMEERGYASQAAFARQTDLQTSTLSRWITDPTITPEPRLLARVAQRLAILPEEEDTLYQALMRAAGHIAGQQDDKRPRDLPIQAREVAVLLGQNSPLAEKERERLGELLDILLRSYRKLPPAKAAR